MFITPITPLGDLSGIKTKPIDPVKETPNMPFQDIFKTAIDNLKETDIITNDDTAYLAAGEIDDLHTLGINATKAYLAERLVVELRNRAMEAYTEILRINV